MVPRRSQGDKLLQEGFNSEDASRLTGATPSQLRYWDKLRLVQPSIQGTEGRPGKRRKYSFRDLVMLRVVVTLKANGLSLQRIGRAWNYLRRQGVDPRDVKLVTDGATVFSVETDNLLDLLQEGQLSFFMELEELTRKVDRDETLFELNRDQFLHHVGKSLQSVQDQLDEAVGI
ncbi:MAG: MerR family transcriptional regulator [Acidimicrobiia bacterium]|nr:MerR family transcriptional regulator [Acidimicrobiia bacterium]MYF84002.1 MerR family transcriptional regulator [Acidimicrobiia bacterium]